MSQRLSINGDDHDDDDDGDGDGDGDDDDDKRRKKRKRRMLLDGSKYKKGLKRAKRAVFSPFNKLFKRDNTRSSSPDEGNGIVPKSITLQQSDGSASSRGVGSYFCCLCMSKEPETVDISSDEVDPNDPRISYVYVKTLLEQNEFYSKECNTHFAV